MKKVVIVAVILLVVAGGFWYLGQGHKAPLVKSESVLTEMESKLLEEDSMEAPIGEEQVTKKVESKGDDGSIKELSDEDLKKIDEQFEKVEKEWATEVEQLFVGELGLNSLAFEQYKALREAYDEDKYEAERDFHDFMRKKYGEKYSYNPTETQEIYENRIQEKYESQLKKILGEKSFIRYLEVREKFNQQIMEEQDPKDGVMLIDF